MTSTNNTTPARSTVYLPNTTATAYGRWDKDKNRRQLRFLGNLRRTLSVYLPELQQGCPVDATGRAAGWRTIRVRPEIMAAIEALQTRYTSQRNGKLEVPTSEVLAAALSEALPIITSKEFRG
jgi:hypothetical protein